MAQTEEPEWRREVIELRLHEYDSLRTEVIHRVNARQQAAGYAGALTAITAGLGSNLGPWGWAPVIIVLMLVVLFLRDSNKAVQRIGMHLQQVEQEINALAADLHELSDAPILTWELRRQGQRSRESKIWRSVGIIGGWHLRRPSKELPPTRRLAK